jgi:hypothetical protein
VRDDRDEQGFEDFRVYQEERERDWREALEDEREYIEDQLSEEDIREVTEEG